MIFVVVCDMMRNIKLTVQYDGTNYHGFQTQINAVAVQDVLEDAIGALVGHPVRVSGCGRTDAGVHAKAFVLNFFSKTAIPAEKFPFALNTRLPRDILCVRAEDVASDFDAKDSAIKKRYTYYIQNSPIPDVFRQGYAWHYKYPLDIVAMQKAAEAFLGTHDFIGFASAGFTVKTTVRTIYELTVQKTGDLIAIDVTGNGFLYNMVRIIAGTLVFAGMGKIDPAAMPDIIRSGDRERAGITAPACGLFLSEVFYD